MSLLGMGVAYTVAAYGLAPALALLDPGVALLKGTGAVVAVSAVGGLAGYFLSPWVTRRFFTFSAWLEARLQSMPLTDILAGALGLVVGLIIANLLGSAFARIPFIGPILPTAGNLVLGYVGWMVALKKKEDLMGIVPSLFRMHGRQRDRASGQPTAKILDTSVIIDGRIADLCETGFIEGTLLIPGFVLEELRHIADSSDQLKRNRGRRGLDILNKIQKELKVPVEIYDGDGPDGDGEVDSKLVYLARALKAKVVTNDFNLNKVAELQGVPVLNINELANAVKPVVLPGEEMSVQIIKDGKESGQGVGYLDDGTMIVVDSGRKHIGEEIEVLVTSVLQTAAGRMIFARPKLIGRNQELGHG